MLIVIIIESRSIHKLVLRTVRQKLQNILIERVTILCVPSEVNQYHNEIDKTNRLPLLCIHLNIC